MLLGELASTSKRTRIARTHLCNTGRRNNGRTRSNGQTVAVAEDKRGGKAGEALTREPGDGQTVAVPRADQIWTELDEL